MSTVAEVLMKKKDLIVNYNNKTAIIKTWLWKITVIYLITKVCTLHFGTPKFN